MILNHHRGLLNGAKDHLEGYPPLIHRWCSRYFVTNIWKNQRSKEVIARLKTLCKVKEEKKFEARPKELEKILNDDVNAWLFEQLPKKSKWALAFDESGSRYGIMTMNILEVFNFILKGIHSLPISSIVDYTFHKCNEYFVSWLFEQLPKKSKWALAFDEGGSRYGIMTMNILDVFNFILKGIHSLPISSIVDYTFHKCNEYFVSRWEKARWSLAKGEHWREPARKYLLEHVDIK
jgi:hypothetical protein